ncbi:MAG: hypothetical protein ACOX6T_18890 [Myxococcales bacterium]
MRVAELESDKRRLEERLRKAEPIIDVQETVSQLLPRASYYLSQLLPKPP